MTINQRHQPPFGDMPENGWETQMMCARCKGSRGFSTAVALIMTTAALSLLCGCSIGEWAIRKAGSALSGSGTVFSGDDDPELIADALPFALKTYESLLQATPDNAQLLLATGSAFTMYAYAFVQLPADTLPDAHIGRKKAMQLRAKKLYLRGRDYLFRALEVRYPGAVAALRDGKADSVLAHTAIEDTALLYWTGASWMGAFTADKFDMALAVEVPMAVALVRRTLELDSTYGRGSAHDFFVSYYGAMPASMGGSEELARKHFARSVSLSDSLRAGPYVALATSVCVANQDVAEFRELLQTALAIDIDALPAERLANTLSQRKARWLLDHTGDLFLDAIVETSQGDME
ncbi:MAG: hypothetical protein GF331_11060 [Chitinivibrionales bacterium]|nr:hypothetical protein [Chitinivibrionales bacterium]